MPNTIRVPRAKPKKTIAAKAAKPSSLTPEQRRKVFEAAIVALPDEAFGWLVLACLPSAMMSGAHAQVWPDGLGGFQDSAKIEAVRAAAQAIVESN